MNLLPICINNNINYMVDFENKRMDVYSYESESRRPIVDSFIIAADNEGTLLQLTGGSNPNTRTTGTGILFQQTSGARVFNLQDVSLQRKTNDVVDISITFTSQAEQFNDNINGKEGFKFDTTNLLLNYPIVDDTLIVNINFVLHGENNICSRSIKILLAPSGQIRDAVIDSGSESSQYAMFNRTENVYNVNFIQPIFENVFAHFKGFEHIANRSLREYALKCVQAESNGNVFDNSLFKSRFFVKRINQRGDISLKKILPEAGSDESPESVFRMLTCIDDLDRLKESHIQLCNMKISSFGGIKLPNIYSEGQAVSLSEVRPDSYFYRKYMGVFIYGLLDKFCHEINQENIQDESKRARVFSLYVLMPNVYSCEDIQKYVDLLICDIQYMIDKNEQFRTYIKGFSITPVSESDASLIGAKGMQFRMNNQSNTYLIIDAGKGTLDFSITEMDNHGNFNNLMKSGIVGASAAISYGFMLDLLDEFFKEKGINVEEHMSYEEFVRQFIYGNILGHTDEGVSLEGGDICILNDIMNAIDSYKIRYSSLRPYEELTINNTNISDGDEKIRLSTFTNWINECKMQIPTNNVNAIIDIIISYFISKLIVSTDIGEINRVIFSGRGFLYEDFKNKMLDTLKEVWKNIKEEKFIVPNSGATNKNICLFITDIISAGKYNFQYMPQPYNIDEELLKTLKKIDPKQSDDDDSLANGALKKRLKTWIPTLDLGTKKQQGTDITVTCNRDLNFKQGYDILCAPNSHIAIGGSFYQFPTDLKGGAQTAKLFYNNGKIEVRYLDINNIFKVQTLVRISNLDTGLAFPSLFPYISITNPQDIFIPKVNKQSILTEISKTNNEEIGNDISIEDSNNDNESLNNSGNSGAPAKEGVLDELLKITELYNS